LDLARDEQLRRFEALISATSDFIAIASVDGKVEFLNQDGRWDGISTLRDWRGGPPIPVEISSFLMQDPRTGEPLALATVQRDLRERVGAERQIAAAQLALRAAEDRQQALLLHMSDLLVVVAADNAIVYVSPPTARVLGYAPGENLGACLLDLIHPDDRDAGAAHFEAVFAQAGLSPAVELRLQTADGSWRRYEAIANNLLDDSTMAGVVFHR